MTENILPFMVFLEELDHAVHAALKFREGALDIHSEAFVRDLELQAKVDTYLVLQKYCCFFNTPQRLTDADRRWLKACIFDRERSALESPLLAERYTRRIGWARRYVRPSRRSLSDPPHDGDSPLSQALLWPRSATALRLFAHASTTPGC